MLTGTAVVTSTSQHMLTGTAVVASVLLKSMVWHSVTISWIVLGAVMNERKDDLSRGVTIDYMDAGYKESLAT